MLKKITILVIMSIFLYGDNFEVHKFNLNTIKKCSDTNKDLLCRDNHEWLNFKNFYSIQDNRVPICDNNQNNMYMIQKISNAIEEPKITTTKIDNKTIMKQTYETKVLSNHEIKACKNENELIIRTENKEFKK